MSWSEVLFSGWIGILVFGLLASIVAGLLSLPSRLWSRFHDGRDWIGWMISVAAALALWLPLWGWRSVERLQTEGWPSAGNTAIPTFLLIVVPQLLAYPLTRTRPQWRSVVAILCVIAASALWAAGGSVFGVVPG